MKKGVWLKVLVPWSFLFLLLISIGWKNPDKKKKAIKTITSKDLLALDYTKMVKVDSAEALVLCNRYPIIFGWDWMFAVIKNDKLGTFKNENIESQKVEYRDDFLKRNDIYKYEFYIDSNKAMCWITKSNERISDLMSPRLILYSLYSEIENPFLISENSNFFNSGTKSITNFYSDQSIVFIRTEVTYGCLLNEHGKVDCLSTRITNNYIYDHQTKQFNVKVETVSSDNKN